MQNQAPLLAATMEKRQTSLKLNSMKHDHNEYK